MVDILRWEKKIRNHHLKVIRFIFIIQVYFLLEDGEWISDEEVSYVLGQQIVNSCKTER